MKNFPNVQESAELKAKLQDYIFPHISIDWFEGDLNRGAKTRIGLIREFYEVPKTEIAKMLDTSYRQYLRFEEGDSSLPTWVLMSLALFFNLSVDFVCGLSNEPRTLYNGEYKSVNGKTLPESSELNFD